MADEPKKQGRPTKFNEIISEKIMSLAEQGKTDEEIADIVGISSRTLRTWKHDKPGFLPSLKEAKYAADQLVEASLFRRAIGYTHKAVKMFQHEGLVIKEEYEEHYPPDTTAAIFWLKNRQPADWRDKQEIAHTDKDGNPLPQPQIVITMPSNGREKK